MTTSSICLVHEMRGDYCKSPKVELYALLFYFQLVVMATGVHLVRHVDIVRLETSVIKLQDIVHSVR